MSLLGPLNAREINVGTINEGQIPVTADESVTISIQVTVTATGEVIPGVVTPPTPETGVGPARRVRVRQGKGLRLREYELRQQWRREEEEERQKLLKPRRRPKREVPIPEVSFTSESAGITVEQEGWSLADEMMDEEDILTVMMLADA